MRLSYLISPLIIDGFYYYCVYECECVCVNLSWFVVERKK